MVDRDPLCAIRVTVFMFVCGKKVDDDDLGLEKAMAAHSGNGRSLADICDSVMSLIGRSDTEDETASARLGL